MDKVDTVGKVIEQISRYLQAQARFADAAGTREGDETHLWSPQEGAYCLDFLFASNQRRELRRQVVGPNVHLIRQVFSFDQLFPGKIRGRHKERPPRRLCLACLFQG